MSLSDGDSALWWDVWLRVLTDHKYWRPDGTLKNRAFGGKAFSPPKNERAWSHELSGRLLSLIKELERESKEFCEKRSKNFAGLAFANVQQLRANIDGAFDTDVRYTPIIDEDEAHADFVAFGACSEEDVQSIRDWLQDHVRPVKPDKIQEVYAIFSKPDEE